MTTRNREEQVARAIFPTIEDVEHLSDEMLDDAPGVGEEFRRTRIADQLREVGAEWIDEQGQRGVD